jgi:hypothetical protein
MQRGWCHAQAERVGNTDAVVQKYYKSCGVSVLEAEVVAAPHLGNEALSQQRDIAWHLETIAKHQVDVAVHGAEDEVAMATVAQCLLLAVYQHQQTQIDGHRTLHMDLMHPGISVAAGIVLAATLVTSIVVVYVVIDSSAGGNVFLVGIGAPGTPRGIACLFFGL